jgi:hypothetical protein
MNIALGALIITILLLPGAVVQRAYYTSFRQKDKELHVSFSELLFRGLIISFFVHTVGLSLLKWIGNFRFNFDLFYKIIIADKFTIDNTDFTNAFIGFGYYNIGLYTLLYFITKFFRRIVLDNNLDIKIHSLRTANYWFLIFSARYLEANKKGRKQQTDVLWVDVMVADSMVYSGYLYDFEYSPSKDELETLTLMYASKRTYKKWDQLSLSKPEQPLRAATPQPHPLKLDAPRPIQGDAFVILAKEIININVYYINIRKMGIPASAAGGQPAEPPAPAP